MADDASAQAAVREMPCAPADPGAMLRLMARGVVKFYNAEKGWGAISSPQLPDGLDAWVHFSAIEAEGYRSLDAGGQVDFDYEKARQDSFQYRATRARKL